MDPSAPRREARHYKGPWMADKHTATGRGADIPLDRAVAAFKQWLIDQTIAQTCGPRPLQTSFNQGVLVKFEASEPRRLA